jgi:putative DNA primase/helicase
MWWRSSIITIKGEEAMVENIAKDWIEKQKQQGKARKKRQEQDAALAELPPEYSEGRLSERFTDRYSSTLRFVEEWGTWLHWNGTIWVKSKTYAFNFARLIAREAAIELRQIGNPRAAMVVYSNRVVAAIESLARKNVAHLTPWDAFDADDWMLNTPSGVVDLRTGELLPHHPKYMLTKMTAATPDFEMATPIWNNFLSTTLQDDPVLIAFLRRLSGYCLTGSTKEEVVCFIYGLEGTGKTTFMETIAKAMGDYATVAVIESLTQRKNTMSDRHSTDIAKLQGARLARAAETEEGRYWSAAKIKELTGGDTTTARFMRQDNVDFVPKCKIIIHGNFKPRLRNPEGIRRRLILIDFSYQIPESLKNIDLKADLKAEAAGILAWCVRGCSEWQKAGGLLPPEKVQEATAQYFAEQETMSDWLEECCRRTKDKSDKVTSTDLYKSYKRWCVDNGEEWLSQKKFSQKLESLGVEKGTDLHTKAPHFKCIQLLNPLPTPDERVGERAVDPPRETARFANGGGAVANDNIQTASTTV